MGEWALQSLMISECNHWAPCCLSRHHLASVSPSWIPQVTIINQGSHSHSNHDHRLPTSLTLPKSRIVTTHTTTHTHYNTHATTHTLQHARYNAHATTHTLQHTRYNTHATTHTLQHTHYNTHTHTTTQTHYHTHTHTLQLGVGIENRFLLRTGSN